ncbi:MULTISPECIES: beta family protein [unclassified Streptomyces]|uniref:beta family protein n=1 Tax=unclassified Streptomyces TaxID=2593676 RepID=UPI002E101538|nr:beta family protein [Streptomyces sp. NBC_01207]WTA18058.1 beta family protein [Streptomyces sp. NBC_00853]
MSGPLYVPVLSARPHAADAYARLRPDVQNALMPVWNLLPRPGLQPAELVEKIRKDLAVVSKVQRYRPAWLDAPFASEDEAPVLAELLPEASALGPLRPVTGPGRPEAQQTVALATARTSGDGLGIRVRVPGEWDERTTDRVRDLLERADPVVQVDLLLDLGTVRADRPDAGKEALRALDALVPLAPWRNAAVLSGGFPDVTADLLDRGLYEEPRSDWRMWHEIRDSGRAYRMLLSYGDYGIQPAATITRPPSSGKGGPSWGFLRYTAGDAFMLGKMLARGDGRIEHNRATARELLAHPGFRGPAAGAAEGWLRNCAHGLGTGGTGLFATWLWVGNAQHMSYVVRSL